MNNCFKIILFLGIFISQVTLALDKVTFTFHRPFAETITFNRFPNLRLTISEKCGQSVEQMSCKAYQGFLRIQQASVTSRIPRFGQNLGAIICTSDLADMGGTVEYGKDENGNENTFCAFDDGSLIDNGSLWGAAIRKARQTT